MAEVVSLQHAPDEALARAAEVLRDGGVVVLPTDTVYGVAALPASAGATERLFRLKGRSARQPLAVLVADAHQARPLVDPAGLTPVVEGWMTRWWPGALTIVVTRSTDAASMELGGAPSTIGLRCPALDFVRDLARLVGPVATTSANHHGVATPTRALAAAGSLTGPVDLVVDGGPAGTVASTVVDATAAAWHILRNGAVTEEQLRAH